MLSMSKVQKANGGRMVGKLVKRFCGLPHYLSERSEGTNGP